VPCAQDLKIINLRIELEFFAIIYNYLLVAADGENKSIKFAIISGALAEKKNDHTDRDAIIADTGRAFNRVGHVNFYSQTL